MCTRILNGIKTKINIANVCSVKTIHYSLTEINTHSCPLLKHKKALKIRKFIVNDLKKDGFDVENVMTQRQGDFWTIKISW